MAFSSNSSKALSSSSYFGEISRFAFSTIANAIHQTRRIEPGDPAEFDILLFDTSYILMGLSCTDYDHNGKGTRGISALYHIFRQLSNSFSNGADAPTEQERI